jgi:repressor LexA
VKNAGGCTEAGLDVTQTRRVVAKPAFFIQLTTQERELLLEHVVPPNALDRLFGRAASTGPVISLHLSLDELDEFMRHLEETAYSAQNLQAQDRLGQLLTRLDSGLSGDVDEGAHMVRPAAARLGYTRLQGQYLAFIYYYTKLHRRSPAEADLQAYFRVSPPAVHDVLRTLQRRRFIARTPAAPRSIRILLPPEQIPDLE